MKQIQLTDTVMVSDPCYTEPTWCQIKLKNVLPGTYNVEADKKDCSGWGERVHSLQVIHSDYSGPLDWEEAPGDVGVDSGQAGIFSYDSYRNDAIASGIQTEEPPFTLPHREEAGDRWYEKMCEMTLSKDSWGVYDNGVVSSSGIGDGGYPLFIVRDRSGFIVAMRVEFLSDEEEYDECPECGAEMDMGDEICESCQNEKEYNANI